MTTGVRLCLLALLVGHAGFLASQDTSRVQVIRPEARTPDTTGRVELPASVVAEVLAFYNDSLTTRVVGNWVLPAGARLAAPLAIYRGSLRVMGEQVGRVLVINGDLLVDAGATVTGDVLVVGGSVIVRPGGTVQGARREFATPVAVTRTGGGLLALQAPPRTLGELASARATVRVAHFRTDLSVETGRTYNRVEGLPIVFGPSITREGLSNVEARLDLRGIAWTAPDQADRRAKFGYSGRLELRFGSGRRFILGGHAYRIVAAIEEQPLSRAEAGWSAFLLQRDYRDFYQSQGITGYATYRAAPGLTLSTSLRRDGERSLSANDPISVFRNAAWRPNPLVDDGHFESWRIGFDYDTRNDPTSPTSGWLVRGFWERSRSDDAAPVSLPAEVRDPLPPGRYRGSRLFLDARRYARLNPSVTTALRVMAGGWLGGDPLPVQRRFSLGGPDVLPGYGFRTGNCAPASLADPSRPALCDRMIAAQLEVRSRAPMGLPIATTDPFINAIQRILAIREPEVVVFGDAGKAWITGEGAGRVPNNRIPVLREWSADLGFGFDAGGIGLYVAQPMTGGLPVRLTLRLQRRF